MNGLGFHLDEDKEVPTIMANFTCYTGNCTLPMTTTEMLLEMSSTELPGGSASSGEGMSPEGSLITPYTTLQASLIGKPNINVFSSHQVALW